MVSWATSSRCAASFQWELSAIASPSFQPLQLGNLTAAVISWIPFVIGRQPSLQEYAASWK